MKAAIVLLVIVGLGIFGWYIWQTYESKVLPISPENPLDTYVRNHISLIDSANWEIFFGSNDTLYHNFYYCVYWWNSPTLPHGTYNRADDGRIFIIGEYSADIDVIIAWIDSHPVSQM